jgi:hypothetical protein
MMVTFTLLLFLFSAPAPLSAQELVEGIVAIVTSKRDEATREMIFYSDLERYRIFFFPQREKSDPLQRLNQVVEQHLLLQEARRFIPEAPDTDAVEQRLAKIRTYFHSETLFQDAMRQTGLIESELKNEIREILWIEQLLDERINGFIFISPKSVEDYYQLHSDFFSGRSLREVNRQIEIFLLKKRETEKKAEYLERIKEKAEIKILLNEHMTKFGLNF